MRRRVLVVDDEDPVRELLEDALGEIYRVATADSGAAALAQVEEFRPDVVLLDFNMPRMTGLDVLRAIKARDPSVIVIMVTGTMDPSVAATALELGAFAFLGKPFEVAHALDLVAAAVAHRAPRAAC